MTDPDVTADLGTIEFGIAPVEHREQHEVPVIEQHPHGFVAGEISRHPLRLGAILGIAVFVGLTTAGAWSDTPVAAPGTVRVTQTVTTGRAPGPAQQRPSWRNPVPVVSSRPTRETLEAKPRGGKASTSTAPTPRTTKPSTAVSKPPTVEPSATHSAPQTSPPATTSEDPPSHPPPTTQRPPPASSPPAPRPSVTVPRASTHPPTREPTREPTHVPTSHAPTHEPTHEPTRPPAEPTRETPGNTETHVPEGPPASP